MRRVVGAAAVVLLLGAAVITRLFVYPSADGAGSSDAVVVLAGDAGARLPVAVRLAREGAGVLAVSVDDGEDNAPARALCEDPGDLEVHCFTAARSDTRAEARELGRLVDEQDWATVAVVTNSYHVFRAGLLVDRCTDAEIRMVDARSDMPLRRWVAAVPREIGGVLVALGRRSC
jgi:uncharacterized SAM-binding protein YcdF (DUF218 family)